MSLHSKRKPISDHPLIEGSSWIIGGFLRSIKKLGKLNFGIVSDGSSQIQVLFNTPPDCKKESVVLVKGTLVKRKSPNLEITLGEWEIMVEEFEIISHSRKTLPFEVREEVDSALEPIRLKHRYLDLRRNNCHNLIKKSQAINSLRNYLLIEGFTEVQTPVLSVSSREGANTFEVIIPKDGKQVKFSLSQSPQLYKQLLMMGGLEKYFQFATCYRFEDLRADRQYEFLQLDLEMAFSNQEKLFDLMEKGLKKMMKEVFDKEIKTPFRRISHKESLEKYGSDKPDTRLGLEMERLDLGDLLSENGHEEAYGFYLENCSLHVVEEKWLKSLQTNNKVYMVGMKKGVVEDCWLMNENMDRYEGKGILKGMEIGSKRYEYPGVWIITTVDHKTKKNALISMGNLRFHFSRTPKRELREHMEFLWVVNWPLFEWNESQSKWCVAHHLFTMPESNNVRFDRTIEKSRGYDLVLNGVELGSGSQRNHLLEVQKYMFECAGLTEEEVEREFGWFLEAFNYGVPPHMGIALGIDRLMKVVMGLESIRDVIAFPKNNSGVCSMTNSPTEV